MAAHQARWLQFFQRPSLSRQLMLVGLAITGGWGAIALLAPLFVQWGLLASPQEFLPNPLHQPPSAAHWFGTSRQGYDIFARTVFGSRAAFQVVILATSLSLSIGVPLGLISGY
ncbi:MAG: ABC transporter permease, partial [Spirulina sp. DLM2.Bin59]